MERADAAKLLVRFMNRYDRFLLSGHVRPDGDAVGSVTALALALKNMGKEPMLVFDGDASRYTNIVAAVPVLPEDVPVTEAGKHFKTGKDFAFVMLDCSDPERTGRAGDAIMAAQSSFSIDHHVTNREDCDFSYCEPETSSACEILYSLFKQAGIPIDLDMATALFMGVSYDTGGFRHSNTGAETLAMAADLKKMGVDNSFLMNYLFYTVSLEEARCYAAAVKNSKLYDNKTLISCLFLQDFTKLGAKATSADGIVGRLTEIEEAEVVIFLREIEQGQVRVNMRSKSRINVARIAGLFGGGGHVKAAGCTVTGPMLYVKEELLKAIDRQMEEYV